MNSRKCPCCKKDFTFKDYIYEVLNFKKKIHHTEKGRIIKCKHCSSKIVDEVKHDNIYYVIIPFVFLLEVVREYFMSGKEVSLFVELLPIIVLLLLLPIVFFIVYRLVPFKCYQIDKA